MNYFNKLKGFQHSPEGLERQIWKFLHIIFDDKHGADAYDWLRDCKACPANLAKTADVA